MPVNSKKFFEVPGHVLHLKQGTPKRTASELRKPRYMTMVCTVTIYRHNTHRHLRT